MKKKGFDSEISFSSHDNGEKIKKWYEKKVRSLKKPLKIKDIGRIYRYLLSKGFNSGEIINFLKKEGIYEGERD